MAQLSVFALSIQKSGRPGRDPRPVKRGVSQVVFFSNLPRGSDKKMELLTISRRFGTVEKHLFLNDEASYICSNFQNIHFKNVCPGNECIC